jgi:ubiquinone/menaquinone biosynthesis C-methylase UbiE
MTEPHFAKPDRYKLDSYRTFNFRLLEAYDSCIWLAYFRISRWDEIVVEELMPRLESADILDVGCATGRLMAALYDAGAKNVCGVDLAPRILDVARSKLAARGVAADLRFADAEDRIPWPDASFDAITLTGVLHHLTRPEDALIEFTRLLRPRGSLIVVDPWFFSPFRQVFNLCLRIRPFGGDYRFYSPATATRVLAGCGWRNIQSRRAGWSGFMMRAERPR